VRARSVTEQVPSEMYHASLKGHTADAAGGKLSAPSSRAAGATRRPAPHLQRRAPATDLPFTAAAIIMTRGPQSRYGVARR